MPHYLRVVRALALVAIVPGCTGVTPSPEPVSIAQADAASPADAAPQPDAAHDDVDAGYPFSSGPIVPPELPASLS